VRLEEGIINGLTMHYNTPQHEEGSTNIISTQSKLNHDFSFFPSIAIFAETTEDFVLV
jgi:hypothetical protein